MLVLQFFDELVYLFFCDMLHNHDVGEFPAETVVIALGKRVFPDNLRQRAPEEHRVAVLVHPARPVDGIQLLLEIGGTLPHLPSLLCPAVVSNRLNEPPEFQRLQSVA